MNTVIFYCPHGGDAILAAIKGCGVPGVQYLVHVPPPPSHPTTIGDPSRSQRVGQLTGNAAKALVEFRRAKWDDVPGTWQEKGATYRGLMADVPWAKTWIVNEASSGMRKLLPGPRQDLEQLLVGLGGSGYVCQQWVGSTNYFSRYQQVHRTQSLKWQLNDTSLWETVDQTCLGYVWELYASVADWAAWTSEQRDRFLFDPLITARHGRQRKLAATVLDRVYVPLINAYWNTDEGYGNTKVTLSMMQAFITQQLEIVRARSWPAVGIAWNQVAGELADVTTLAEMVVTMSSR